MSERKPFWAKCEPCGHCWAVYYLPMPVERLKRYRYVCPMCGAGPRGIVVARQNDGVLLEGGGWTDPSSGPSGHLLPQGEKGG